MSDPNCFVVIRRGLPSRSFNFAKDWNEDPTSNNHVMLELAKSSNKVLWLNSLATRTPNLASARDLKKIILKLGRFFRGAKEVRPNPI